MTLKRTIHRREARKRAKAALAERKRRRDAMSPKERESVTKIQEVFKDLHEDFIRQRIDDYLMWQTMAGIYDIKRG